ncbi:MAG: heparinase II/III family protein [Ignavibacteriales bacterium]|nr:heparinase II/III family protein [Ignavibacteriales bacterium]
MKRIFLFFIIIVYPNLYFAQSGAWHPTGADTSFPRTLLKSSEIQSVRNSLLNSSILPLYANIYNSALLPIPSGNSEQERSAKSHIAKNAAFVILLGKKYADGAILELPGTESDTLTAKVITILETFPTDIDRITVENPAIYDSWQWRSKQLIDFAIAYDLLRGSGVPETLLTNAQGNIQEFAGHLCDESTRLIAPPVYPISFFDIVFNNHSIMTASALGMAAVVINDAVSSEVTQQPLTWIQTAMWNIENINFLDVNRQSSGTGLYGYAEGPGYLRYGMLNCLPFLRAMGNFAPPGPLQYVYKSVLRTIPNPYSDSRYDSLFDWIAKIRMPDGRLPTIEDTYADSYFTELALWGKSIFIWPNSYSKINTSNALGLQLTFANLDLRSNFIASLPVEGISTDSLFQALPESGNLVFRSSSDSNALYMHVTAKHGIARSNSYGHNQADVTSFLIYSKGEVLALDPGYISYDRRGETGNAQNHNMILVDNNGPTIGDPQFSNDADGYIENSFDRENLDYGEARTNYLSVDIKRNFLFIRKKYFLNADFVSSTSEHNYTWQMHGFGKEGGSANFDGVFLDNLSNSQGLWKKGNESILAHVAVSGSGAVFTKVDRLHEYDYNSARYHTAMYVTKTGNDTVEFLSFLYPFTTQSMQSQTLVVPSLTAIKITDDTYTDVAFVQRDTILQTVESSISALPENLYSDGSLTFFSFNNPTGEFDQWFVKDGKNVGFGTKNLAASDTRVNVAVQKNSETLFTGYASRACSISLYLNRAVLTVSGNNVTSWSQNDQEYVQLHLAGSSYFTVQVEDILPVELVAFKIIVKNKEIELQWQTATELNNAGFEIQRKNIGESWKAIGFVAGAGNSQVEKKYTFTDSKPSVKKSFYRLKILDNDGSYTYSPEVEAKTELPQLYALYQNFPNPFNPETKIEYFLPYESEVKIIISNTAGETIAELVNNRQPAGYFTETFNSFQLTTGVYLK